jgi:hypothetical protein
MTYILRAQRGSPQEMTANFARYRAFLAEVQGRLPTSVHTLATADWYYDTRDSRCPHDAWLEQITIEEPASGERREQRSLSIHVRLFGAYHDGFIQFRYSGVNSYNLALSRGREGHSDWLFDEFRLSEHGLVLHEIEWAADGHWLIEASDVNFSWHPTQESA